jgi:hypothetical protein
LGTKPPLASFTVPLSWAELAPTCASAHGAKQEVEKIANHRSSEKRSFMDFSSSG